MDTVPPRVSIAYKNKNGEGNKMETMKVVCQRRACNHEFNVKIDRIVGEVIDGSYRCPKCNLPYKIKDHECRCGFVIMYQVGYMSEPLKHVICEKCGQNFEVEFYDDDDSWGYYLVRE